MADVCVITGGGSGMGLAAAKYMPKEKILVLAGRTEAKLQRAIEELKAEGHEAYAKACDTSKRESVRALAEYAASLGEVKKCDQLRGTLAQYGGGGDDSAGQRAGNRLYE